MTISKRLLVWSLLLAILCSAGCGWWRGLGGKSGDRGEAFDAPAQVLANEAETAYKEGNWDEAADLYQQLKDRYPYSRFALLADLRVGDAYYKAKRYDEAVLAFDDFIRLHPKNEGVPYAYFQMGMVHHSQMLTPDRDPSNARKAADAFQRLVRQYPKSEWAQKAFPRLKEALERQANHDMFVGDFYLRTKQYEAAIGRFKRVLTQYPDVGLYGDAMAKIQKAQEKLDAISPEERAKRMEERRDLISPPALDTPRVPVGGDSGPPSPF
ncbi:MAG: outer membrane protein assembly factor BamD [Pseudomonadota bacterium]